MMCWSGIGGMCEVLSEEEVEGNATRGLESLFVTEKDIDERMNEVKLENER